MGKKSAAKKQAAKKAPPKPELVDTSKLPVTDPRRKLTEAERKALTPEQKKARRQARRAQRKPLKQRILRNVERMVKRFDRFAEIFAKNEDLHEQSLAIGKSIRGFSVDIGELPDTFTPPRREGSRGASFTEGQIVCVIADKLEQYLGSGSPLTKEQLEQLKVVSQMGRKVVCETPAKTRYFFPVAHIEAVDEG